MISRISRNAVKEGFDTLPAAICYFDRNGLLRLINHRMQEIAAVLCGCDLQTLADLEQALRALQGRPLQGASVQWRQIQRAEEARGCHLLFVTEPGLALE